MNKSQETRKRNEQASQDENQPHWVKVIIIIQSQTDYQNGKANENCNSNKRQTSDDQQEDAGYEGVLPRVELLYGYFHCSTEPSIRDRGDNGLLGNRRF